MATIPALTSVTGSNASVTYPMSFIRTSLLDQTNANYPRQWILTDGFLVLQHSQYKAAVELSAALPALLALVPQLTWPPIVTSNPSNVVNAVPTASSSFSITATSEIAITYAWQVSTDGGASFSNLSNAGVYSNVTTATMGISSCNGLSGNQYRVNVTNGSGTTTSAAATLTTDPAITTQPSNLSVVHPAVANFTIVASGQTSLTYQWQKSTDGGSTWADQANSGVYSLMTTAAMHISDSTGLNALQFRCKAIDSNGTVTSSAAILTVT